MLGNIIDDRFFGFNFERGYIDNIVIEGVISPYIFYD